VESDDDVIKLTKKTYPHHDPLGPKPPIQIWKKFFLI